MFSVLKASTLRIRDRLSPRNFGSDPGRPEIGPWETPGSFEGEVGKEERASGVPNRVDRSTDGGDTEGRREHRVLRPLPYYKRSQRGQNDTNFIRVLGENSKITYNFVFTLWLSKRLLSVIYRLLPLQYFNTLYDFYCQQDPEPVCNYLIEKGTEETDGREIYNRTPTSKVRKRLLGMEDRVCVSGISCQQPSLVTNVLSTLTTRH